MIESNWEEFPVKGKTSFILIYKKKYITRLNRDTCPHLILQLKILDYPMKCLHWGARWSFKGFNVPHDIESALSFRREHTYTERNIQWEELAILRQKPSKLKLRGTSVLVNIVYYSSVILYNPWRITTVKCDAYIRMQKRLLKR